MRTTVCSGILALSLLLPVAAQAQGAAPAPASEQLIVLRPSQLLAIGTGVVVGALVAQVAIPTRLGLIAGAVLGGYIGDFWYTGSQIELHISTPKT